MEKLAYHGWQNCYRLTNDTLELIVTTDVGPRIIHFGLRNQPNEFTTVSEQLGRQGDDTWQMYGGHRFWVAPEAMPRTYYPDNDPVIIEAHENVVRLIQPTENTTHLQKEIDITLAAQGNQVTVTHRLKNHSMWAIECAPWAISVMAPGGTAVFPLPPRGSHDENLLPNTHLNLWAYTNMQDSRWHWGEKYILLRQEPGNSIPQKIGGFVSAGWTAYSRHNHLFVVTFTPQPDKPYPDTNSNVELFTNDFMLEVETLGPLVKLPPGTAVTHTETWHLFADIPTPQHDDDVTQHILPLVQKILPYRNTNHQMVR